MTVAEIQRYMDGAVWRIKSRAQFDYTLADLVGASVARVFSSDVKLPPIDEVYPYLFNQELEAVEPEQAKEEIAMENSVNNFLKFARQHNAKIKKKEVNNINNGNSN